MVSCGGGIEMIGHTILGRKEGEISEKMGRDLGKDIRAEQPACAVQVFPSQSEG